MNERVKQNPLSHLDPRSCARPLDYLYSFVQLHGTECSCSLRMICENISNAAAGWKAGYGWVGHAISTEPWRGRNRLGGTHHLVSGLEYASAKRIVQSLDSHEGV